MSTSLATFFLSFPKGFLKDAALTPTRMGIFFALATLAIFFMEEIFIFPGFILMLSIPESNIFKAISSEKCMSAIRGIFVAFFIFPIIGIASLFGTAILKSSQPAFSKDSSSLRI